MSSFLAKLFSIIMAWILDKGIYRLLSWIDSINKRKEKEEINKTTREKLESTIAEGKSDAEISQATEDALNSTKR